MNDASNRGIYRSLPVRIVGATHEPPQPYLVPIQMEEFLADYKEMREKLHIIDAVSIFHLRFEDIHPFIDGNGRIGRLILNLELMKYGLLPVNIKFANRREYYDCFDAYYSERKDFAPMSKLISAYEEQELRHYLNILN